MLCQDLGSVIDSQKILKTCNSTECELTTYSAPPSNHVRIATASLRAITHVPSRTFRFSWNDLRLLDPSLVSSPWVLVRFAIDFSSSFLSFSLSAMSFSRSRYGEVTIYCNRRNGRKTHYEWSRPGQLMQQRLRRRAPDRRSNRLLAVSWALKTPSLDLRWRTGQTDPRTKQ